MFTTTKIIFLFFMLFVFQLHDVVAVPGLNYVFISPQNGTSTNSPGSFSLVASFNVTIAEVSGNLTLVDRNTDAETILDISPSTNDLTVTGSDLTGTVNFDSGRRYHILITAGAVNDTTDNSPFPGLLSITDWTFSTSGTFSIQPSVFTPPTNSNNIPISQSQLQIEFNQNIFQGTSGNLNIIGGGDTFSILFSDTSQLTISSRTLTISLASINLKGGTFYHVTVPNDFLQNANNLGITGWSDTNTWNFTTFCNFFYYFFYCCLFCFVLFCFVLFCLFFYYF